VYILAKNVVANVVKKINIEKNGLY